MEKIIRTLCLFKEQADGSEVSRLERLSQKLTLAGYEVQTTRLVCDNWMAPAVQQQAGLGGMLVGAGDIGRSPTEKLLQDCLSLPNLSFHMEINDRVTVADVDFLFYLIREQAEKTFLFSYVFQNVQESPFFPAAGRGREGFSIGLQATNLAMDCNSLHSWLYRVRESWYEVIDLMKDEPEFLGIDSSIAPLFRGDGSLVHHIKRIKGSFPAAVTSDVFVNITRFIKEENPMPLGLQGLMFPCLEDFDLADEYEQGEFSIERNIFLSLHSGLGIDTYPIGVDESPARVRDILNLLLALASKYNKPLSARFVSDGKSRIGQRSDFNNKYLKDVIIKPL